MVNAHPAVILALALLALFLISLTIAKYAIPDNFTRTRVIMSALFLFIVMTLTVSFGSFAMLTLPYVVPAFVAGAFLGHIVGVRADRQKLMVQGLERYMEHFAHISHEDVKNFTWWSFVNFYSIMASLVLINLVGLTNVILKGSPALVIATSVVGAAFIGSIVPYLVHLWTLPRAERQVRQGRSRG